jgi:perosamine synthetase
MFEDFIDFVKEIYGDNKVIPLHEPLFIGNEKQYLNDCIDSTFVSSIGKYVDQFERNIAKYIGVNYAVATSNGTSALHVALLVSGVMPGDEVITQPLSFIATCNAINYCGASPVFIDTDYDTMGLSPIALQEFLENNCNVENQKCINKKTNKVIRTCLPMHTFGHPCKIKKIKNICEKFHLNLVEDAAESLGSTYDGKHTGTYGSLGIISFNGNKIITGGGGGVILTNNKDLAKQAKHITTTARVPHQWEYRHDMIGYNYRMPNINAALLCAQLENLDTLLLSKRDTAMKYQDFIRDKPYNFFEEPAFCESNYWLNSIRFKDQKERDLFLKETNKNGVSTRPIWSMINKFNMFDSCQSGDLSNSELLERQVVNIPSSAIVQ